MAITKDVGRQDLIVANVKFTLGAGTNVAAQGVFPALELPAGAVITGGYLKVTTATSASVTLAVGVTGAPTEVLGATSAASAGVTAVTVTGTPYVGKNTLNVTVAGATPVTAGEAELTVTYFVKGRAEFTQG